MSIAVWVGLIALLGVDAETAVFMLLYLDLAYHEAQKQGADAQLGRPARSHREWRGETPSPEGHDGGLHAVRLVADHVVGRRGADVMKRIAAPMIGGILTSFLMELVVYPPIFAIWKWNFEVKPKLKQTGPKHLQPKNMGEPVHA